MANLESRLATIPAYDKREYVSKLLVDKISIMEPTEKALFADLVASVACKDRDSYHATLSAILAALSMRGFAQLDKFVYDVSVHSSLRNKTWESFKKAFVLCVQGAITWLFVVLGAGV